MKLSIFCSAHLFSLKYFTQHTRIGYVETSVNGLIAARSSEDGLKLRDAVKIIVHKAIVEGQTSEQELSDNSSVINSMVSMSMDDIDPKFSDYILGGCEISLIVAIDFTGSNGDPRVPGTLHHQSNGVRNDYEKAILAIGNILSKYDSDKKFPVR